MCQACGQTFQNIKKPQRQARALWQKYTFKKQTLADLVEETGQCLTTIQQKLKQAQPAPKKTLVNFYQPVALVCDTTYFATYGVMVWRCFNRRANLLWRFVQEETVADYLTGIAALERQGYIISAVTCDGHKGLLGALKRAGYPAQLCQFHLLKTITRYLTKNPQLEAGQDLRRLVLSLSYSDEESFNHAFALWSERWEKFLQEKTYDPISDKWQYTHRRLRSASRSIIYSLPYLFTFEHFPELNIPKTTNTLDGTFSHLKQKVHIHRGLSELTEKKMIESILIIPSKKR